MPTSTTKPPPKIQKESIWRTLPRACFGLIAAVVLDVVAMLGYATLLLMDGASPSAFYFAAVVLTGAFILVFFTMSAVLSENTIELLATVCVGTCVTIMVFWLRLGGGNLDQVQRIGQRVITVRASAPGEVVPWYGILSRRFAGGSALWTGTPPLPRCQVPLTP